MKAGVTFTNVDGLPLDGLYEPTKKGLNVLVDVGMRTEMSTKETRAGELVYIGRWVWWLRPYERGIIGIH